MNLARMLLMPNFVYPHDEGRGNWNVNLFSPKKRGERERDLFLLHGQLEIPASGARDRTEENKRETDRAKLIKGSDLLLPHEI